MLLLLTALIISILYHLYKEDVYKDVYLNLEEYSLNLAEFLDKEISMHLSYFGMFGELIKSDLDKETGELTDTLMLYQYKDNHLFNNSIYSFYYIHHDTGNVYPLKGELIADISNQDLRQSEWYNASVRGKVPSLSPVYNNQRISKSCLTISYPVIEKNRVLGVLCGDIIVEDQSDYYYNIFDNDTYCINVISPQGLIIINKNKKVIGKSFIKVLENKPDKNDKETMSWNEITENQSGRTAFVSLIGEQVVSTYNTCDISGWKVFCIANNSFIQTKFNNYLVILISIAFSCFIVVMLFLFVAIEKVERYDSVTGLKKANKDYSRLVTQKKLEKSLLFIKLNNLSVIKSEYEDEIEEWLRNYAQILKQTIYKKAQVAVAGEGLFVVSFKKNTSNDEAKKLIEDITTNKALGTLVVDNDRVIAHVLLLRVYLPNNVKKTIHKDLRLAQDIIASNEYDFEGFVELNLSDIIQKSTEVGEKLTILRHAMKNDALIPFYQPIYNLKDSRVDKYEVLMRIKQKNKYLAPFPFILIGEKFNLIQKMDLMVIERALKYKAKIDQNDELIFSFNVSGKCLNDDSHLNAVTEFVSKYGINPACIQFEITETSAIHNIDLVANIIDCYVAKGYRFLIDDFGVAYSTIDYLKRIPCDYLKIDGEFIKEINISEENAYLAQSIVLMAKAYNKKTIAEYVENEAIFETVKRMGVDYVQGYYIGRPEATIQLQSGYNVEIEGL